MKKLLLILLCLPMIGFGQSLNMYKYIVTKSCNSSMVFLKDKGLCSKITSSLRKANFTVINNDEISNYEDLKENPNLALYCYVMAEESLLGGALVVMSLKDNQGNLIWKNSSNATSFSMTIKKLIIPLKASFYEYDPTAKNKSPVSSVSGERTGSGIVERDLSSSVNINIPTNSKVNNRYALIIGNEDYTSRQRTLSSEQNVDYAVNDATIFKKYCLSTLGVKEENMFFLKDATAIEMNRKIELVSKIIKKLGNKAELIVYYAGHGYPDETTKVPYLIPVDVPASDLSYAIKLDDFYKDLGATGAKNITVLESSLYDLIKILPSTRRYTYF